MEVNGSNPVGRTRPVDSVTIQVEHGDCLEVLARLAKDGAQFDACVTDPPYHLTAMTKRFGKTSSAPAKSDDAKRLSKGFMGQSWDGGDVSFQKETWGLVADVLKPGSVLLAFGGCRTYHRMVCAIEDAGFVIQDLIGWLYGSGMAIRHDMLKTALEPICFAYKPGGPRLLNIDECRSPAEKGENFTTVGFRKAVDKSSGWARPHHGGDVDKARVAASAEKAATLGRYPANFCHDGLRRGFRRFSRGRIRLPIQTILCGKALC